jgi:hypothetical protein
MREALAAGVRPSAAAMESLVRHGVRAGRPSEVTAAFLAVRDAGGRPTLRTYTDLVSALSKRQVAATAAEGAGRRRRGGGSNGRGGGGVGGGGNKMLVGASATSAPNAAGAATATVGASPAVAVMTRGGGPLVSASQANSSP